LQSARLSVISAIGAAFALSACAAALPSAGAPATATAAAPASVAQRDLNPDEKKAIMAAVALSIRDPASAKYHWTTFPAVTTEESVNYCATVDAKSPFPAYSGHQAYIVETTVSGGKVTTATMGLIAGGKDAALVAKMCAKYGLDPNKSS
jgi:hypothetical protein